MKSKFLIIALTLLAFTVTLSGNAEARRYRGYYNPHVHYRVAHYRPRVVHYRRATYVRHYATPRKAAVRAAYRARPVRAAAYRARPVRAAYRAPAPIASKAYSGSSNVVAVASRYIGTNPGGWRFAWCGAFVDRVLGESGHQRLHGNALWAPNYNSYGVKGDGSPGDVVTVRVTGRTPGGDHVAFVYKQLGGGRVQIIGGNQGRGGTNILTVSTGSIISYRRPV